MIIDHCDPGSPIVTRDVVVDPSRGGVETPPFVTRTDEVGVDRSRGGAEIPPLVTRTDEVPLRSSGRLARRGAGDSPCRFADFVERARPFLDGFSDEGSGGAPCPDDADDRSWDAPDRCGDAPDAIRDAPDRGGVANRIDDAPDGIGAPDGVGAVPDSGAAGGLAPRIASMMSVT